MFADPKIVTLDNKKLVGHAIDMSLTDNKTFELFSGFMPNRKQIQNTTGDAIYEVMIYNDSHFKSFSPANTFTKWATLEVTNCDTIPEGLKTLDLEAGLYSVFQYKGLPQGFGNLMRHILTEWLPKSEYQLDSRPHFNILGENYKKGSPDSEEEVFIPIRLK